MTERIISDHESLELARDQLTNPLNTAYTFVGALPTFNYMSNPCEGKRDEHGEQNISNLEISSATEVIFED